MSGVIDPTKPAKYPVILSDALMERGPAKEIFTNIRYNHKPTELSSETANARLKPSTVGSTSSYDLSFQDEAGKFAYAGTRVVNGNQYVLYFDAVRKAFILDRVDSSFNMNLTRTPDNTNPESLAMEFAQLDTAITVDTGPATKSDKSSSNVPASSPDSPRPPPKVKSKAAKAAPRKRTSTAADKKKKEQKMNLSFPTPAPVEMPEPPSPEATVNVAPQVNEKPKKKKKKRWDPDSEDEDDMDDDDDGLEIIDTSAAKKPNFSNFSPGFQQSGFSMRAFSDFVQERAGSENESVNDSDIDNLQLDALVGGDEADESDADGDGEMDAEYVPRHKAVDNLEADLEAEFNASAEEADLEADFAAELDKELGQGHSAQNVDSESEVSEAE